MKKLIISTISLLAISTTVFAKDFNSTEKLNCFTAYGSYDEVQKMVIHKSKNGKRDLEVLFSDKGYFKSACVQDEYEIKCSFNGYEMIVDLTSLSSDYDLNDELKSYSLDGTIDKFLRSESDISCKQYL